MRRLLSPISATTHVVGDAAGTGTPLINGANQSVTYEQAQDSNTQNLIADGFGNNKTLKQGDVFTIANVFAVNPVTKATEDYLQQFAVTADMATHAAGGDHDPDLAGDRRVGRVPDRVGGASERRGRDRARHGQVTRLTRCRTRVFRPA